MGDLRLNCAAGICCSPQEARATTIEILYDAGCDDETVESIATYMEGKGIVFLPVELATVIREIAFPEKT